jgi:peptidase A4-like protein
VSPRRRIRVPFALFAIAATLLIPMPANASAHATGANPCPAGTVWQRPVSTSRLSDGGTLHHYVFGGDATDVAVPPVGFSPGGASDAALARYGMPPRPSGGADLAAWNADMASWHRTPDRGLCTTDAKADADQPGTVPSDADPTGARFSLNWGGFITDETSNTYIAVQGDWTQPSVSDTICNNETHAAWVGLGGYNTDRLIQDGTAYLRGSTTPVAWYEYLGTGGVGINLTTMPSVTVHKGDRIHSYVVIQRSSGQTTFYVADNTTGTSQTVIKTLSVSTYYDGTSSDFIDERLSYGSIQNLYNFVHTSWTNTKVQNLAGTWLTLGSRNEITLDMENIDNDILVSPGTMTSTTTFLDDYKQCG